MTCVKAPPTGRAANRKFAPRKEKSMIMRKEEYIIEDKRILRKWGSDTKVLPDDRGETRLGPKENRKVDGRFATAA